MEANVSITYQNKRLIASGTFFTFGEGETTLLLEYKNDYIKFVFDILNDESEHKNVISSRVVLPDTLRVTIQNYRMVMGNAVVGPTELGEMAGTSVFMLLSVRGAKSDGSKGITYSIYVQEGK
ncbi:MAG: hypothetical protein OEZ15_09755 [Gammaproteobacteria bacterium]|nr:hypothetical protein [Gammaproteobacteria bacterium]